MRRFSRFALSTTRLCPLLIACAPIAAQAQATDVSAAAARYEVLSSAVEQWVGFHPDIGSLATADAPTLARSADATVAGDPTSKRSGTEFRQAVVFTGNLDFFDVDPSSPEGGALTLDDQLLQLAQTMGLLRAQLKAAGYPESLYEAHVHAFELSGVRALAAGRPNPINSAQAMEALMTRINNARERRYPNLPQVEYVSVQYASFVRPVILRSKPAGGRVWVISELRFEVCKRSVADPYDTDSCPRWREADAQNPMYLAGTYDFQVLWKNGRNARGQRTIYNDQSGKPIVYELP